jgi:hypothetical protein
LITRCNGLLERGITGVMIPRFNFQPSFVGLSLRNYFTRPNRISSDWIARHEPE